MCSEISHSATLVVLYRTIELDNIWHLHSLSTYRLGFFYSKVNSSVRKIYILRPNREQLRKMQLQGCRLGIEPATKNLYSVDQRSTQSVERWSRDTGSRFNSQPEALKLHFSQLLPVGS